MVNILIELIGVDLGLFFKQQQGMYMMKFFKKDNKKSKKIVDDTHAKEEESRKKLNKGLAQYVEFIGTEMGYRSLLEKIKPGGPIYMLIENKMDDPSIHVLEKAKLKQMLEIFKSAEALYQQQGIFLEEITKKGFTPETAIKFEEYLKEFVSFISQISVRRIPTILDSDQEKFWPLTGRKTLGSLLAPLVNQTLPRYGMYTGEFIKYQSVIEEKKKTTPSLDVDEPIQAYTRQKSQEVDFLEKKLADPQVSGDDRLKYQSELDIAKSQRNDLIVDIMVFMNAILKEPDRLTGLSQYSQVAVNQAIAANEAADTVKDTVISKIIEKLNLHIQHPDITEHTQSGQMRNRSNPVLHQFNETSKVELIQSIIQTLESVDAILKNPNKKEFTENDLVSIYGAWIFISNQKSTLLNRALEHEKNDPVFDMLNGVISVLRDLTPEDPLNPIDTVSSKKTKLPNKKEVVEQVEDATLIAFKKDEEKIERKPIPIR